jgi:hypothetical protein
LPVPWCADELAGCHHPVLVEQDQQQMRWTVRGPQPGQEGTVSHGGTADPSRPAMGCFR